jgi:polyisoprenoid-binding protein YceI
VKTWQKLVGLGVIAAVLIGVVGPYVYINFVKEEAPEALDISPSVAAGSVDPNVGLDGTWVVAGGSQVGYRVKEILFGQSSEAVGRTSDVTGSFTIAGSRVTEGKFEADLTTMESDEERRDRQFQGRIMNTAQYPTATLTLTQPLDLSSIDSQQTEGTATATGDLSVHGVTKSVTFDLEGVRSGSTIQITGSMPIVFADYGIDNPSGGPAQTEDNGILEFAINFEKEV